VPSWDAIHLLRKKLIAKRRVGWAKSHAEARQLAPARICDDLTVD
jgi:hypothetical protein